MATVMALAASAPGYAAGVSRGTWEVLEEAAALQDDGAHGAAAAVLEAALDDLPDAAPDRAWIHRRLGYVALARERSAEALAQWQRALRLPGLDPGALQDLRRDAAVTALGLDRHEAAAGLLDAWLAATPAEASGEAAEIRVLRAHARFGGGQYGAAAADVRQALAEATAEAPPVAWLELLAIALQRAGAPLEAAAVQSRIVERTSGERAAWLRLAALYEAGGDGGRALAALELGHRRGVLGTAEDLRRLAARYRDRGLPRRAAELLEAAIARGALPDGREIWVDIGAAWEAAAAPRRALAAYREAVAGGAEGALLVRAAQLLAARHAWAEAAAAAQEALAAQPPEAGAPALLVLGIARLQLEDRDGARAALRAAAALPGGDAARAWLELLDTRDAVP